MQAVIPAFAVTDDYYLSQRKSIGLPVKCERFHISRDNDFGQNSFDKEGVSVMGWSGMGGHIVAPLG
jgi:hypothetical protein